MRCAIRFYSFKFLLLVPVLDFCAVLCIFQIGFMNALEGEVS